MIRRVASKFWVRQLGGLALGVALALGASAAAWAQTEAVTVSSATNSEIVVVTLLPAEGGAFTLGGEPFTGGRVTLEGGFEYVVSRASDGTWTALYQPKEVTFELGELGGKLTLVAQEDGTFADQAGMAVVSSQTWEAAGNTYRLTLGEDGAWTGTYVPPLPQLVALGTQGSVSVARAEDGTWWTGESALMSGDTRELGTNATGGANAYRLTLENGEWSAAYVPTAVPIAGTDLQATPREDGKGYTVEEAGLAASGRGDITVRPRGVDEMYHVWATDGGLVGVRFDDPIRSDRTWTVNVKVDAGAPTLSAEDRKADAAELRTMVKAVGTDFALGELLGSGTAAATPAGTVLADVRTEIGKLRDRARALVDLLDDEAIDRSAFDSLVNSETSSTDYWDRADTQIARLFGGTVELERESNPRRLVGAFEALLDDLESEAAFTAATADGGGVFGFANLNAAAAKRTYNATQWSGSAVFSALGNTRFGAATRRERANAKAASFNAANDKFQVFAWSTTDLLRRTDDVPQRRGNAVYTGRTHAVDSSGKLYSGNMELSVRFVHGKVDGLVSNLATADDERESWEHGLGGAVQAIFLPTAAQSQQGAFSASKGDARVKYARRAGGLPEVTLEGRADLTGRLLGRGDDAGSEAVGTWAIYESGTDPAVMLAGAFGAERRRAEDGRFLNRDDPSQRLVDDLTGAASAATFSILKDYLAGLTPTPVDFAGPRTTIATTDGNLVAQGWGLDNDGNLDSTTADGGVKFTLNRETLFGEGYPVQSEDEDAQVALHEFSSDTHVTSARKEITRLRNQLRSVIALDGASASAADRKFANGRRQAILTAIQTQIADEILGGDAASLDLFATSAELTSNPAWDDHTDYPVNPSGRAQDTQLLADLDEVVAALQSVEALAEAFASGGIFHSKNDGTAREALEFTGSLYEAVPVRAVRDDSGVVTGLEEQTQELTLPVSHVWNKASSRLLLWTDATDFTRFGAWRIQRSRYAADNEVSWRGYNGFWYHESNQGEGEPFAYSPLTPVAFVSASDRSFPGGVRATYRGRTVALQDTVFMTGDIEARVAWDAAWGAEDDGLRKVGTMRLTVDNIVPTDPTFDALRHGIVDYRNLSDGRTNVSRPGTFDVRSLQFDADISVDSDGKASFQSDPGFQVVVTHDTLNGTYDDMVPTEAWYTTNLWGAYDTRTLPGQAERKSFDDYYTSGDGAGKLNVDVEGHLDAVLAGSFVGPSSDGPAGIIGTWSIIGDITAPNGWGGHWLGVGNARTSIHGAFGAEFAP